MNFIEDLDPIEPTPDEILAETVLADVPIGVTFASGMHESDLLSFIERAKGLAGETY